MNEYGNCHVLVSVQRFAGWKIPPVFWEKMPEMELIKISPAREIEVKIQSYPVFLE
jgi:hypothetical protein